MLSIAACFIFQLIIKAQDIHFSQYEATPLLTNPANSGQFNEYWRLGFNFREQWNHISIPYKTMNFFFDQQVHISKLHFSAGGHFLIDQITLKGLNKNYAAPTVAYHLSLKKNIITLGIQPGIGIYRFNASGAYPDQYDDQTGYFNPSLPSSDNMDNNSRIFFDFGIGLNYSREMFKSNSSVGFAVYHLNRPEYSFYNNENSHRLPMKYTGNIIISIPVRSKAFIQPKAIALRQDQSQEIIAGFDYVLLTEKKTKDIKYIFIGPHFRTARSEGLNTLVIKAGFKYKGFRFGFNYDNYFSSSTKTSKFGSTMELSLIYSGLNNFRGLDIFPCDRF